MKRLTALLCACLMVLVVGCAYAGCLGTRACSIGVSIPKSWCGTEYGYNTSNGLCAITYSAQIEGACWHDVVYHWYDSMKGLSGSGASFTVPYEPNPPDNGVDHIHLRVRNADESETGGKTANVYVNVHPFMEMMIDGTTTEAGSAHCVTPTYACNEEISPTQNIVLHSSESYQVQLEISVSAGVTVGEVEAAFGVSTSQTWTYETGRDYPVDVPIGYCARLMVKPVYTVRHGKKIRWQCDGSRTTSTFTIKELHHFEESVDIVPAS